MKKLMSLILAGLLLLTFPGCGEEEPQEPVVYAKPTFTPGTLESDLLKAEPGNYQRCADTTNLKLQEIETGYYMEDFGILYYADHTNLDAWFRVCADPSCSHDPLVCSAGMGRNGMYIEDNRLWFLDTDGINRLHSGDDGIYLVSTALNGTDWRWEYSFEEGKAVLSGGGLYSQVYQGGFLYAAEILEADGSYRGVIYLVDKDTGPKKIFETTYENQEDACTTNSYLRNGFSGGIHGDLCIRSAAFSENSKIDEVLCWFRDGEPVFSDVSKVSVRGAYLSGGTLRYFLPGDGYYDLNLLTGEITRLADAQLQNSSVMILQPNCIIESTLLVPDNQVEEHQMRLFDGQQWHTVTLPEGINSTEKETFCVGALGSDRVMFYQRSSYKDAEFYNILREKVTLYQIKLGADGYVLEYMGTNQMTTDTMKSYSYNY